MIWLIGCSPSAEGVIDLRKDPTNVEGISSAGRIKTTGIISTWVTPPALSDKNNTYHTYTIFYNIFFLIVKSKTGFR